MVGEAGIEPTTTGLEGRCSIQLSYSPSRTPTRTRAARGTPSIVLGGLRGSEPRQPLENQQANCPAACSYTSTRRLIGSDPPPLANR